MVNNAIKLGYKQTELGVIPEDWDFKRFDEVMDGFASGQTPYRGRPEYYTGNIPWITSGELNYNIITDTLEKITPKAVRDTNLKIIPKGTFLFAITGLEAEGTRGACAITGIEATTNQSCMALYPKKALLITPYLYHFYIRYGNWLAFKYCQGTKQQSYTGGIAKTLPITVPSTVEEQSTIAQVLSDTDALIESLDKFITKKKNIKQGAIQALLTGKKRLPEFSEERKGYKQTEVGIIPEEWDVDKLDDCLELLTDFEANGSFADVAENVAVYDTENYAWYVRATDLENKSPLSKVKWVDKNSYIFLKKTGLYGGELLITKRGEIGKIFLFTKKTKFATLGPNLYLLKLNQRSDPLFLFYYFKYGYGNYLLKSNNASTTLGALYKNDVKSILIPHPIIEEQSTIAHVLFDMDTEIKSLEQKRDKYLNLKTGMMQQLLTGRIRLKWNN